MVVCLLFVDLCTAAVDHHSAADGHWLFVVWCLLSGIASVCGCFLVLIICWWILVGCFCCFFIFSRWSKQLVIMP